MSQVTEHHLKLADEAIAPQAVHQATADGVTVVCGHCEVRDRVAQAIADAEARGSGAGAAPAAAAKPKPTTTKKAKR